MKNINQQVNNQLSNLKLSGIRDALLQQLEQPNLYVEQSFEERLSLLLEYEITQRDQLKIDRLTNSTSKVQSWRHACSTQLWRSTTTR